ncbi:hypothetical protein AB0883_22495 [Micromonospora sp. NPDC047812]|uniref:hypothetical protein n=1 Tax=Micromonospora sp. NPDC047812 TaxID=3155742 RepID=UPI003456DA3B
MTHRVSPIDDHRRIVPGRANGPAGGNSPAGGRIAARGRRSVPPASRGAAAHPPVRTMPAVGRPAPGGARTVPGRFTTVTGSTLAAYR